MPLLRGGDEEEREDRSRVPEVEVPGVRGVDHGEFESTPIPFTPLRCPRGGILRVPRLELLGAEVPQRGVYPHPVVE